MYLYDHFIQDELFKDQKIGVSRVHTGQVGEMSSPSSLGGYFIWIEGEAYNALEVAEIFGLQAKNLSELLLLAEKNSILDECLNQLDGYFCAALYDKENEKIKLISDRYGMRFLYWYHMDAKFVWGSEVKAILAGDDINKRLDHTSYECFMEIGYLMGEHTWFENIKLIKPATIIEYDIRKDEVNQHYYWKWSEIKPLSLSFDQAVDELGERFIEAVEKRFKPNEHIGISLSGGLDSRAIFAAVEQLYPDYKGYAYSFGVPHCDDITIAERVVTRSKTWLHDKFYFSSDNWFHSRVEKVWNTDGMQDMMHMHGSEFFPVVADKIKINLNGYAGDAILGGSLLNNIPTNEKISFDNAKGTYKGFISLSEVDSDYYHINSIEPHLYMNRVRRFTAYGSVNALPWIDQRKPFFDNKIVELVFSLPNEYRVDNRLYSSMLLKFFPKYFKDIPWQLTGKPVGTYKAKLWNRAYRKAARTLSSLWKGNDTWSYTNYPEWIRDHNLSQEINLLLERHGAKYKMITDDDVVEKYLSPHLNNKHVNKSNQVLRAATIELYLNKVFKVWR